MIRSKLPPEAYRPIVDALKVDRLKLLMVAAVLGRETWESFWAVYRDSIEFEVEKMLTLREKPSSERGIFG